MCATQRDSRAVYEIRIEEELDQSWEGWFGGLKASREHASGRLPTTTLTGAIADQAALRGILCKLWDLNLTVVSVRRTVGDDKKEEGHA